MKASSVLLAITWWFLRDVWGTSNVNSCSNRVKKCIPTESYFETKLNFKHATTISQIEYNNTYVKLSLSWDDYNGPNQEAKYVLVRCGCPDPANVPLQYKRIFVPVSSAFVQQTVTVPKLYLLGQREKFLAIETSNYVTTEELLNDVEDGTVIDINYDYSLLTNSSVMPTGIPDVLITGSGRFVTYDDNWNSIDNPSYYNNTNYNTYEDRRFIDTDSGEGTPLGRAELLKLYGILFGVEMTASAIFESIEKNYMDAKTIAIIAKRRPSVMKGVPYDGNGWTVTPGKSYWGRYFSDAMANYLNNDDKIQTGPGGTIPFTNFTTFFRNSQYWIDTTLYSFDGSLMTTEKLTATNYSGLPNGDADWYKKFLAFRCGMLYSQDNRLNARNGGNKIYEEGVVRPDLLLLDLVKIFHAQSFEVSGDGRDLYFYRKLDRFNGSSSKADDMLCHMQNFPIVPPLNEIYLEKSFLIKGLAQYKIYDIIYEELKPEIVGKYGLSMEEFEIFVNQDSLSSNIPALEFSLIVAVRLSINNRDRHVTVAKMLNDKILTLLSKILSSNNVSVKVHVPLRIKDSSGMVENYSFPKPQPNLVSNMSDEQIAALVGGSLAAFLVICLLFVYISYRAGTSAAYKRIELDKRSIMKP